MVAFNNLLVLLGAASQRIEYLALEFIGTPWLLEVLADWKKHERGALPGPTESSIMFYIISKKNSHECRQYSETN